MRNVVVFLAACSLFGCSSPGPEWRAQEIQCGALCSSEPASTPVITFVLMPSSITRGDDGVYRLGFALSYTDDQNDGSHSVRIESGTFTLEAPLPIEAPNAILSPSVPLPEGTSNGTLDFTITVVSDTGGSSKPYRDSVFLL